MMPADQKSRAICILGMHRSGTSTVARAVNLLGVSLGEPEKMMPASPENPEGYWEHLEIYRFQKRLMAQLQRNWDTLEPLPSGWHQAESLRPFKNELSGIIADNFSRHALWAWKEPQTCLLLPLWREALETAKTELSCLFVVRSPVDVANSVMRRDGIPFEKALGLWFHHNIVALNDAAGLPLVFLNYDRLLAAWEPELRRCAQALELDWPEEAPLQAAMNAFIKPNLRHNQSAAERLQQLPHPAQELYQILLQASTQPAVDRQQFDATINRLLTNFQDYASFFPNEIKGLNREVLMTWRNGNGSGFQCMRVQAKNAPPRLVHQILGDKFCRSICKRLAQACCWLQP